jgi:hypothetical protein
MIPSYQKMNTGAKALWLAMLRSGNLPHGINFLRRDGRYNALGMLAQTLDDYIDWAYQPEAKAHVAVSLLKSGHRHMTTLPRDVCKEIKLANKAQDELCHYEATGATLPEIINWIEDRL